MEIIIRDRIYINGERVPSVGKGTIDGTGPATVVNQKARPEYYRYPTGYQENFRDSPFA